MSGTRSRETISTCLPKCCSIMPQARMDPMASPSGRECAATRNLLPRSMASRTARISFGFGIGSGAALRTVDLPLTFAMAAEQVVNARLHLFRPVDVKDKVRSVPDAHTLVELVADVSASGHQAFESVGLFLLTTLNGYVNLRGLPSGVKEDLSNVRKADAGVGKLPLDHGADFVAQCSRNAISVILTCPGFRHLMSPSFD